jgi:hypothetical protein
MYDSGIEYNIIHQLLLQKRKTIFMDRSYYQFILFNNYSGDMGLMGSFHNRYSKNIIKDMCKSQRNHNGK